MSTLGTEEVVEATPAGAPAGDAPVVAGPSPLASVPGLAPGVVAPGVVAPGVVGPRVELEAGAGGLKTSTPAVDSPASPTHEANDEGVRRVS